MRDEQNNPQASEIETEPSAQASSAAAERPAGERLPPDSALPRPVIERNSETQLTGQNTLATAVSTGGALPLGDLGGGQAVRPTEKSNEDSGGFKSLLRETVETVVLAVLIFLVIRSLVQNYRIEGQSMEPNFHHGQYLLVNRLAYRLEEYARGDVIVFHYPNNPSQDYIKRVVGLPGDTVEIRERVLLINGIAVDEPYERVPIIRNIAAQTVEPGYLYVLGDNRPASSDTRTWGQLPQEYVIGKAWLAIWPLEESGLVAHSAIEIGSVLERGP